MRTWSKSAFILFLAALGLVGVLLLRGLSLDDSPSPLAEYAVAQGNAIQRAASQDAGIPASLATITVSGTVATDLGTLVEDVWVGVGSEQHWQETSTNASGFYSVSIQTDGQLHFHVRPAVDTRLTQVNRWMDGVTASFTQNFTVTAGYLLDLGLTGGGMPITYPIGLEVQPLVIRLPDGWWYDLGWDDTSRYTAVLPPDVYYVTANDPPSGYYQTTLAFDLRTADQTAIMPLSTVYVHPIPYDPPDAAKITIGSPDDLGETNVTGTSGAALPLANVLLVNLNSTHQAHTTSEADGSFSAHIYAPPGSAIMIKHGPPDPRWNALDVGVSEGLNPFPGTIIYVPHTHTGSQYETPFAAAGAIEFRADDPQETLNYVGSAWAVTGTAGPVATEGKWTRVLTGTYDGEVVPGLYLGGLNWTHPALADLDGDDDLDLLVGENMGHLVLYRNQVFQKKPGFLPDWQFETANYAGVDTGGWAYPALADITNDGALDLFVGAGDGTVAIYYNAGTSTVPIWPTSPDVSLSVGYQAAPALDDLDGDGDLDLLVGCFSEGEGSKLYHFENTGTITNPTWNQRTDNYGGISEAGEGLQPAFVNLDTDADHDLLVGLCGQMIWYERGGTAQNPTWTRQASDPIGYGGGSCGTSPGIGDWDGDGDEDVATGEHWGNLRFFRNEGSSAWTEQGFDFPFELLGDTAPALADWDDDGDLDLLLGQAHGQVLQYTNVGSDTNSSWRPDGLLLELPWTNHPHPFPTFADVDGDDDHDLFVGGGDWDGPEAGGNVRYYQNVGTPLTPTWTLVTTNFLGIDVGGWSTPVFADIDADADLDLFVGDAEGTLTFVENRGTITTPTWAAPIQPYAGLDVGSYSAPAFFDVDQDGDLDLLIGRESGRLAYVRNTGTPSSPAWELVTAVYPGIDVGHRATPAAAGDRLFIGDGDGGLNLYRYEGAGTPPTGTLYLPSDQFQIEGTMRLYSPAITATTDVNAISVNGWPALMMLFNQGGQPLAVNNSMSTLLTPSGFPIQRVEQASVGLDIHVGVENLRYVGGHFIEGNLSASGELPDDLPPGTYRPTIFFDFAGVPTSTNWLAANVTQYTFDAHQAVLPPITVGDVDPSRLVWRLMMDDFVQGTRGTGAREDQGTFELASHIVSQGAPYYTPPVDVHTGQPITYRLEPFLPMMSFTDRRMPAPPLIPFDLPSGQLCVTMRQPNDSIENLGCESFAQSFNRTKTTRGGFDLNVGTVQLEDVYSLKAASNQFRVTFDQYGHHVVTMTGTVSDVWGNGYTGGGTYDVWIAHPLDIDPGVLPGTPLAVGDAFNPAMQFCPRVPADVRLTLTLYPDSDLAQTITHTLTGRASPYGYFDAPHHVLRLTHHGEYRVDLTAIYTDTSGEIYMGAMTWGGVVMTPEGEADLVAHGRRGLDSLSYIPNHWFVASRDLTIPPGATSHTYNPYYNGDILWSRMSDGLYGGDSLLIGASVQDTVGTIEAAIQSRAQRQYLETAPPGDLAERFAKGEIPLFSITRSGLPMQLVLRKIEGMVPDDVEQIAYSYRSSQRPGVRVREIVSEDGQNGGYWRLDTLYDDQLGVGVLGDQPNDFKFQYVGTVYRDLDAGHNEYAGQGTGWIFIPDSDPTGSRVMPPFAGPGNGGWTTEGGPILTLKGEDVHMFILPTGTRPGAVLEVGDTFHFAGHIMPTLDSRVAVTITAPGGTPYTATGQANHIGYFYNPDDDLVVDEAGLWSVDVRVWHDGQCSGGATIPPYPSGDVLGSDGGRYWFAVVPDDSPRLNVSSPVSGFLSFDNEVTPIVITGTVPAGLISATVDFVVSMPGYILQHGQAALDGNTYQITFDPVALSADFPNLDLVGRDNYEAGLADTFAIGLLLQGQSGSNMVYRANTITIQGDQVFIGDAPSDLPEKPNKIYLPLVLRS